MVVVGKKRDFKVYISGKLEKNLCLQFDRYGNATSCQLPCLGDPSKVCGGTWALSVYHTGKKTFVRGLIDAEVKYLQPLKTTSYKLHVSEIVGKDCF